MPAGHMRGSEGLWRGGAVRVGLAGSDLKNILRGLTLYLLGTREPPRTLQGVTELGLGFRQVSLTAMLEAGQE